MERNNQLDYNLEEPQSFITGFSMFASKFHFQFTPFVIRTNGSKHKNAENYKKTPTYTGPNFRAMSSA